MTSWWIFCWFLSAWLIGKLVAPSVPQLMVEFYQTGIIQLCGNDLSMASIEPYDRYFDSNANQSTFSFKIIHKAKDPMPIHNVHLLLEGDLRSMDKKPKFVSKLQLSSWEEPREVVFRRHSRTFVGGPLTDFSEWNFPRDGNSEVETTTAVNVTLYGSWTRQLEASVKIFLFLNYPEDCQAHNRQSFASARAWRRAFRRDRRQVSLREHHHHRQKESGCVRRPLYVNFTDLNWQQWIIAPAGYMMYTCEGHCRSASSTSITNHAIIRNLLRESGVPNLRRACCVPTALAPLSMLIIDDSNTVTLRNQKQMIVKECGCR